MHDPLDGLAQLRRIDPVDPRALEGAWNGSDAASALLQDITAMQTTHRPSPAIVAPPRRAGIPRFALGAGLAAVVIAATLTPGLLTRTAPVYSIGQLNDDGELVYDATAIDDPTAFLEALDEYGIAYEITATYAASPSQAGRIDVFPPEWDGGLPVGMRYGADGTDEVFVHRIDPLRFTGTLRIAMFNEAAPGAPYTATASSFAPGEALAGLHCAFGEPLDAIALAEEMQQRGMTIRWSTVAELADDLSETTSAAGPVSGEVLRVTPISEGVVGVEVLPDGSASVSPAHRPTYWSELPCSGALSAD